MMKTAIALGVLVALAGVSASAHGKRPAPQKWRDINRAAEMDRASEVCRRLYAGKPANKPANVQCVGKMTVLNYSRSALRRPSGYWDIPFYPMEQLGTKKNRTAK